MCPQLHEWSRLSKILRDFLSHTDNVFGLFISLRKQLRIIPVVTETLENHVVDICLLSYLVSPLTLHKHVSERAMISTCHPQKNTSRIASRHEGKSIISRRLFFLAEGSMGT